MRLVSLFAGIGGFDLGFERAGFRTVATVEIDANCQRLLAERWPDAVHLDDVRTAGRHNLPECDVITFGFPCQDLSVAGKREGLKGERSSLFYEAAKIVSGTTVALFEERTVRAGGSSAGECADARLRFRQAEDRMAAAQFLIDRVIFEPAHGVPGHEKERRCKHRPQNLKRGEKHERKRCGDGTARARAMAAGHDGGDAHEPE